MWHKFGKNLVKFGKNLVKFGKNLVQSLARIWDFFGKFSKNDRFFNALISKTHTFLSEKNAFEIDLFIFLLVVGFSYFEKKRHFWSIFAILA